MSHPACLVIGYSRPDGTRRSIESAIAGGVSRVYLAIDGRKSTENSLKSEFLNLVENIRNTYGVEVNTWFREENLGTAASIISALDWFFKNEKTGIILEDDLAPSLDFYVFANDCLQEFENDKEVWLISGNQFFPEACETDAISWSTYPLIWGWATWADKWIEIRKELLEKGLHFSPGTSLNVRNFWTVGQDRALRGLVDSWAILLASQMHAKQKFCALPPVNLVTNLGVDQHAVHTVKNQWPLNLPTQKISSTLVRNVASRKNVAFTMDSLIDARIYGIGLRHYFLSLIEYFRKKFLLGVHKPPLKERLQRVIIPIT